MAMTQPDATQADTVTALATLNDRQIKALTEGQVVVSNSGWAADAPDLHLVNNEDGSEVYRVDAREGSCTCPDAFHRDVTCKHQYRVDYVTGARELPTGVEDRVDSVLTIQREKYD